MSCYTPIPVTYQEGRIAFLPQHLKIDADLRLPCGRCIGCKLDRCSTWALRCHHESKLYKSNYFLTLTFAVSPISTEVRFFSNFMKRLRKYCKKHNMPSPRYFHATEYGSKKLRPHHHAIMFNLELPDLKLFRWKKNGNHLYTSEIISKLWGHGFHTIGAVTHDSIAYTAAYTIAKDLTVETRTIDGQILMPEQMTCSRNPAIGLAYLKQNLNLVKATIDNGFMYNSKSKKQLIPRAYQKWLAEYFPESLEYIKEQQEFRAYERSLEKTTIPQDEMLTRNLRSTILKMAKHVRELDTANIGITLETLKQFRLSFKDKKQKRKKHETVHN